MFDAGGTSYDDRQRDALVTDEALCGASSDEYDVEVVPFLPQPGSTADHARECKKNMAAHRQQQSSRTVQAYSLDGEARGESSTYEGLEAAKFVQYLDEEALKGAQIEYLKAIQNLIVKLESPDLQPQDKQRVAGKLRLQFAVFEKASSLRKTGGARSKSEQLQNEFETKRQQLTARANETLNIELNNTGPRKDRGVFRVLEKDNPYTGAVNRAYADWEASDFAKKANAKRKWEQVHNEYIQYMDADESFKVAKVAEAEAKKFEDEAYLEYTDEFKRMQKAGHRPDTQGHSTLHPPLYPMPIPHGNSTEGQQALEDLRANWSNCVNSRFRAVEEANDLEIQRDATSVHSTSERRGKRIGRNEQGISFQTFEERSTKFNADLQELCDETERLKSEVDEQTSRATVDKEALQQQCRESKLRTQEIGKELKYLEYCLSDIVWDKYLYQLIAFAKELSDNHNEDIRDFVQAQRAVATAFRTYRTIQDLTNDQRTIIAKSLRTLQEKHYASLTSLVGVQFARTTWVVDVLKAAWATRGAAIREGAQPNTDINVEDLMKLVKEKKVQVDEKATCDEASAKSSIPSETENTLNKKLENNRTNIVTILQNGLETLDCSDELVQRAISLLKENEKKTDGLRQMRETGNRVGKDVKQKLHEMNQSRQATKRKKPSTPTTEESQMDTQGLKRFVDSRFTEQDETNLRHTEYSNAVDDIVFFANSGSSRAQHFKDLLTVCYNDLRNTVGLFVKHGEFFTFRWDKLEEELEKNEDEQRTQTMQKLFYIVAQWTMLPAERRAGSLPTRSQLETWLTHVDKGANAVIDAITSELTVVTTEDAKYNNKDALQSQPNLSFPLVLTKRTPVSWVYIYRDDYEGHVPITDKCTIARHVQSDMSTMCWKLHATHDETMKECSDQQSVKEKMRSAYTKMCFDNICKWPLGTQGDWCGNYDDFNKADFTSAFWFCMERSRTDYRTLEKEMSLLDDEIKETSVSLQAQQEALYDTFFVDKYPENVSRSHALLTGTWERLGSLKTYRAKLQYKRMFNLGFSIYRASNFDERIKILLESSTTESVTESITLIESVLDMELLDTVDLHTLTTEAVDNNTAGILKTQLIGFINDFLKIYYSWVSPLDENDSGRLQRCVLWMQRLKEQGYTHVAAGTDASDPEAIDFGEERSDESDDDNDKSPKELSGKERRVQIWVKVAYTDTKYGNYRPIKLGPAFENSAGVAGGGLRNQSRWYNYYYDPTQFRPAGHANDEDVPACFEGKSTIHTAQELLKMNTKQRANDGASVLLAQKTLSARCIWDTVVEISGATDIKHVLVAISIYERVDKYARPSTPKFMFTDLDKPKMLRGSKYQLDELELIWSALTGTLPAHADYKVEIHKRGTDGKLDIEKREQQGDCPMSHSIQHWFNEEWYAEMFVKPLQQDVEMVRSEEEESEIEESDETDKMVDVVSDNEESDSEESEKEEGSGGDGGSGSDATISYYLTAETRLMNESELLINAIRNMRLPEPDRDTLHATLYMYDTGQIKQPALLHS